MYNNQMKKEYWNNKNERAKIALNHTSVMETFFHEDIQNCVYFSKIYTEHSIFPIKYYPCSNPEIIITPDNTVDALFKYKNGKTAILNFSSFKEPGGMFLRGSMAQEESLCHQSFLYNVLKEMDNKFYRYNKENTNRALYFNRAIYSPNVIFTKVPSNPRLDMITTNVITCAAPNIRAAMKYCNVSRAENGMYLKSRCAFVLDIADVNSIDTLILGAYGCGVFGQNPVEVASIFKVLLESGNYNFDNVIFAIPNTGHSIDNYNAFKYVFEM